MRKNLLFVGLAVAAAVAIAQTKTLGALDTYAKKVAAAKSLQAEFSVTEIGGVGQDYTITLSKPNMVRLDTPNQLVVADGTTVTTYDKKAKTYFKQPQTDKFLNEVLKGDEFQLFRPFFSDKPFADLSVVNTSTKKRRGAEMQAIETKDASGKRLGTFYVSKEGLATQLELTYTLDNVRYLVDATKLELSDEGFASDLFAFKAPSDARELSAEEMSSDKWYYDLDEALKAANATGKGIFLDVMASWCGPCKKMEAEVYHLPEFKAYKDTFVFCMVDGDIRKDISARYQVSAYPTVKFLKSDGTKVHEFVGYANPQQVLGEMAKAKSILGK